MTSTAPPPATTHSAAQRRIGANQRRVLQGLVKRPTGLSDRFMARHFEDPAAWRKNRKLLVARGFATHNPDDGLWRITPLGLIALGDGKPPKGAAAATAMQSAQQHTPQVTPPRRTPMSPDNYTGADLLPQQARPGGNHHLHVPSLIGCQRVLRRDVQQGQA